MYEIRRALGAVVVAALGAAGCVAGETQGEPAAPPDDGDGQPGLEAPSVEPPAREPVSVLGPAQASDEAAFSKAFRIGGGAAPGYVAGVATDPDGNVVVAGYFTGVVDFGGGPLESAGAEDVFVAVFDPSGDHVASARFGDAGRQLATALAVDASGGAIVAAYGLEGGGIDFGGGPLEPGALWLAKLDPGGAHVWSRSFPNGRIDAIATDAAGAIAVLGSFSGTTDLGGETFSDEGGPSGSFVAKLDASGEHLWSRGYGDSEARRALGLATRPNGDVVVAGRFQGSYDFGRGPLTSAGDLDAFVALYDGAGGALWSTRHGDADVQVATHAAITPSGDIIVAASFHGVIDLGGGPLGDAEGGGRIALAAFGPAGDPLWSRALDDAEIRGIAAAPDGTIGVAATLRGTADLGSGPLSSAGASDVAVATFTPEGAPIASARFGDGAAQYPIAIAAGRRGSMLVTGAFAGSIDFGAGSLSSAAAKDMFLARLVP